MSEYKLKPYWNPCFSWEVCETLGLTNLLIATTVIQMFSLDVDQACRTNRRHCGQLLFTQQLKLIGIFQIPCMDGLLQVMLQHFNWFKVRNLTWLCQPFFFFFNQLKPLSYWLLFVLRAIIKLFDKCYIKFQITNSYTDILLYNILEQFGINCSCSDYNLRCPWGTISKP